MHPPTWPVRRQPAPALTRNAERLSVSLPDPQPRKHLHTRTVTFRGYQREDGLWDIEAELRDAKTYAINSPDKGSMPPGSPVHDMAIRVTVDDAMTIREITTSMDSSPFPECHKAEHPMQRMVGLTMGPGWRLAIEKALGGVKGCTHLRELLFNMATAAYQTIPGYRARLRKLAGLAAHPTGQPPYHLGKCMSWDFNGPVVARHCPEYVGWQPLKRVAKPE